MRNSACSNQRILRLPDSEICLANLKASGGEWGRGSIKTYNTRVKSSIRNGDSTSGGYSIGAGIETNASQGKSASRPERPNVRTCTTRLVRNDEGKGFH